MATGWNTFPVELQGGLVTNQSRLQQGLKMPGSARRLINFEASIKGGYRRINGYSKFSSSIVPAYGDVRVQGGSQTGTTLNVANLLVTPVDGDSFTIDGVVGTYTIDTGGVSYDSTEKSATLTLTTALDSSPADQASITFTDTTNEIEGVHIFNDKVYALRDGVLWSGTGTTWTKVSTPNYGTVLVNGAAQTGTSLIVDGIDDDDYPPQVGDTFTIAGVALIYTVTAAVTSTSGGATLTISPALDSSPADDAAVTFLNVDLGSASMARFQNFNFNGTLKMAMVDSANYPSIIDENDNYNQVVGTTDVLGAQFVVEFKDSLFYFKDDLVTFTEPFLEGGFNTGLGAGTFRLPAASTGGIVFRDQLFCFTPRTIKVLSGTSVLDYTLVDVSKDIGCSFPDTIQEVAGDVLFMAADGFRFLGATDRIGDFAFANASNQIQDDIQDFEDEYTIFCSLVLAEKNQFRAFGYKPGRTVPSSEGFIGVQKFSQEAYSFEWSETLGIKAYRAAAGFYNQNEVAVHVRNSGYVYQQEQGTDFDGSNINASFYTPWYVMDDPNMRKTHYKLQTYIDPEGPFSGTVTPRLNFAQSDVIQAPQEDFDTGGAAFSLYGGATYGVSTYAGGTPPKSLIVTNVVGSFNAVSYQYEFDGTDDCFIIDTLTVDYKLNDKR